MAQSFEQYREIKRMNASTFVHGLRSMRALKRAIDNGGVDEITVAMGTGIGTHVLMLEPSKFEEQYAVMPQFELDANNLRKPKNKSETEEDRRTDSKATDYYKARVREFQMLNMGKTIVTREQYDTMLYAIESFHAHHTAPTFLHRASFEVSLLGEICGIEFKGRLDIVGDGYFADLKTCADIRPHQFGRSAANLSYDFKLAIYRELFRQNFHGTPDVVILAQQIGGDFDTCVIEVDQIVLDNAWSEVEEVARKYKRALRENVWPGVDEGKPSIPLVVPNWKMRDEEINFEGAL